MLSNIKLILFLFNLYDIIITNYSEDRKNIEYLFNVNHANSEQVNLHEFLSTLKIYKVLRNQIYLPVTFITSFQNRLKKFLCIIIIYNEKKSGFSLIYPKN